MKSYLHSAKVSVHLFGSEQEAQTLMMNRPTRNEGDTMFYGTATIADHFKLVASGDKTITDSIKACWDGVDLRLASKPKARWIDSVAGARPNVPAACADAPESMRSKVMKKHSSPMRMFVSVAVSGGTSQRDIEARGAYLAALVYKIAAVRPLELFITFEGTFDGDTKRRLICVPVSTKPLNLSKLGVLLAHRSTARRFMFQALAVACGGNVSQSIEWSFGVPWSESAQIQIKEALHLKGDDCYIPGLHLHDPLLKNPKEWLVRMTQKYVK